MHRRALRTSPTAIPCQVVSVSRLAPRQFRSSDPVGTLGQPIPLAGVNVIRAASLAWLIIGILLPLGLLVSIAIGTGPSDAIGYLIAYTFAVLLVLTTPLAALTYWIGVKRSRRAALFGAILGIPIGAYMAVFVLAMAGGTATDNGDLGGGVIAALIFLLPGVLSGLAARQIRISRQG